MSFGELVVFKLMLVNCCVFLYSNILGWNIAECFTVCVMGEMVVFKLMLINCCVLLYSNIVVWYIVDCIKVWVLGKLVMFKLMLFNCYVLIYSNIVRLIYCRALYSMSYGRVGSVYTNIS
jgi:hypothetical protein